MIAPITFRRLLFVISIGLLLPRSARPQAQPVDVPFYSLDFVRGLFGKSLTADLAKPKNAFSVETLYADLYDLRRDRLLFMESLQTYIHSVENNEPRLERDFRLNDVGERASTVIGRLAIINERFKTLGAKLSISDPNVANLVEGYFHRNDELVGEQILALHKLNTTDLNILHDIADAAQKNGERLNKALDELRLSIVAAHPELQGDLTPCSNKPLFIAPMPQNLDHDITVEIMSQKLSLAITKNKNEAECVMTGDVASSIFFDHARVEIVGPRGAVIWAAASGDGDFEKVHDLVKQLKEGLQRPHK